MGRAVHRRPDRLPAAARRRRGHRVAARRGRQHHRLPAPQGHRGDARTAGARRHRLAGARGGVLRAARDDAVHEPRAAARAGDRRPALDADACCGSAARSTRWRTPPRCGGPETGSGRYNIPNVGIFLWRLQPFRLSDVPLVPDPGDATGRKFRFNPLGADQPLFRLPRDRDADLAHRRAGQRARADRILRLMALQLTQRRPTDVRRCDARLRSRRQLRPARAGPSCRSRPPPARWRSPSSDPICASPTCATSDGGGARLGARDDVWRERDRHRSASCGRVLLGTARRSTRPPFSPPFTTASRGRSAAASTSAAVARRAARDAAQRERERAAAAASRRDRGRRPARHRRQPDVRGDADVQGRRRDGARAPGLEVVVTARNGARPLIAASGPIALDIGARGRLVLDGLVISGGALQLAAAADDEPRELVLRHCTLVPGLALNPDGSAASPGAPSLTRRAPVRHASRSSSASSARCASTADATIELRRLHRRRGCARRPSRSKARGRTAPGARDDDPRQHGDRQAARAADAARVEHDLLRASGGGATTWKAPVWVERKQEGCVRFSFVPAGLARAAGAFAACPTTTHPDALPHFTSLRYGDPGYAQLRARHATRPSAKAPTTKARSA